MNLEKNLLPVNNLAVQINTYHKQATECANKAVEYAFKAGELLLEAKATVKHGEWLKWLENNFEDSERTAQTYMRLVKELPNLESEKRNAVADLPLRDAVKMLSEPKKLTRAEAINQSNCNEWYTPQEYIETARAVMGGIDLDPASNEIANQLVEATRFFTKAENGLQQPWRGRIWLNPPYGGEAENFAKKTIEEYRQGNIEAAILLLNANSLGTKWFKPLWDYLFCFTNHRIRFHAQDLSQEGGAAFSNVFVYLGPYPDRFQAEFLRFGYVVRQWVPA